MTEPVFQLDASFDEKTGGPVAAYLRVRRGEIAETMEVKEGIAYADYDSAGLLLGIELLGPCEADVLDRVAVGEPEAMKRFLRGGVPRELVSLGSPWNKLPNASPLISPA
jgi:hypothetical protein